MKCLCLDNPFENMPINRNERCLDCPYECHDDGFTTDDGICLLCALEKACDLWDTAQLRLHSVGEEGK